MIFILRDILQNIINGMLPPTAAIFMKWKIGNKYTELMNKKKHDYQIWF